MKFEWDKAKNLRNIKKHDISFEYAKDIFKKSVLTFADLRRDYGEQRYYSLGALDGIIIIVVVHTERNGKIRLISARKANKKERKLYEDFKKRND